MHFVYRKDAKKAIDVLNGFGYDHLILKVEWAKLVLFYIMPISVFLFVYCYYFLS